MSHIPPGKYQATAQGSVLGRTSNGKDQIAVNFDVETPAGLLSLTWYGFFTEAAEPHTLKKLRNLGWDASDPTNEFSHLNLGAGSPVYGKKVELVIEDEPMQDGSGVRSKIAFINGPGGGLETAVKERMSPEEASAFGARMRARIGTSRPAVPQKPKAAPAPARAPAPVAPPRAHAASGMQEAFPGEFGPGEEPPF